MLLLCSFGLLIACCLFSVYRNESPFLLLNPHHPEMTLSLCPRDCFISALCSSMKCVSWPCSPLFKLEGQQRVVTSPSFCVVVSMMMMIMKSGESSQHNLVKTRSLPLREQLPSTSWFMLIKKSSFDLWRLRHRDQSSEKRRTKKNYHELMSKKVIGRSHLL